jgi:hypothetical protein
VSQRQAADMAGRYWNLWPGQARGRGRHRELRDFPATDQAIRRGESREFQQSPADAARMVDHPLAHSEGSAPDATTR